MSQLLKVAAKWRCGHCRDVGVIAEESSSLYAFRKCDCEKGRIKLSFLPASYNSHKIPIDESLESLKKKIGFFPDQIRDSILVHRQLQKEIIKIDALKSPEKYRIFKNLKEGCSSGRHFLSRNPFFTVVSNNRRSALTKTDKIDGSLLEIPEVRSFMVWGHENIKCVVTGARLCVYDEQILDAILAIFHKNGIKGVVLDTTFSDIWRAMGNDYRPAARNIDFISRSLNRIASVTYRLSADNEELRGIDKKILSVEWIKKGEKIDKVRVHLAIDFASEYLDGMYSTFSIKQMRSLSDLSYKIMKFCLANEGKRVMSLSSWRECLGFETADPDTEDKRLKYRFKKAVEELVREGYALPDSGFMGERNVLALSLTHFARNQEKQEPASKEK